MYINGQFKIEVVSKYGEFPIDEHTWALCINIAEASDALLSINVKFNYAIRDNSQLLLKRLIFLRTSWISGKCITGVPPYNKKHRGLLGSFLYAAGSTFNCVETTMEDPILHDICTYVCISNEYTTAYIKHTAPCFLQILW